MGQPINYHVRRSMQQIYLFIFQLLKKLIKSHNRKRHDN